MAGEIQASFQAGKTCYFLVRSRTAQIWNGSSFEAYTAGNYATYPISLVEQGTASAFYVGTFPATITPGVYSIVAKQQISGTPAETDPTIAVGDYQWNGSVTVPLSDLATSGQLGQLVPLRPARGVMILNFGFKMVSAADHITPLISGVISGQIARDGGAFGPLQSGAFTETGLGWYNLQALTSGDLLANTAKLVFTGAGADQRDFFLLMQRTSGQ